MKKRHFRNETELAIALASGIYAGKAVNLTMLHADSCSPSICNCEPEYVVEDLTPESYKRSKRKEAAWRKGATS
jgi:hypothetical protein